MSRAHEQMQNVKNFRNATEELLQRNPDYLAALDKDEELLANHIIKLSKPKGLRKRNSDQTRDDYIPIIYCRVPLAALGITEVLFSFAMSAIQMTFSIHLWQHLDWYDFGDCQPPNCSKNTYLEFGTAACVCSLIAGSVGFFSAKENMKPRSRFWLYIFAIAVVTGSAAQTIGIAVINANTLSLVTATARNLSDPTIIAGGGKNASMEIDHVKTNLDYLYKLKIAMLVLYFILSIMLLASDSLFIMNIIRNRRRYRNRRNSLFEHLEPLRPLGPEFTLMDDMKAQNRRGSSLVSAYSERSPVSIHSENSNGALDHERRRSSAK
ncbi:uncharacterized protein LOC129594367 [Paramacrobiotus metropolitanus]|uniref:uncharacterized protein LOC129594367 n=1 Tax=Paramacrobiotus metropolitanus TaxID=2943436 RepID=UPI0024461493|nr:uncharacterized protein LOC129594367 [Paramacrobiotus metropolitanus]